MEELLEELKEIGISPFHALSEKASSTLLCEVSQNSWNNLLENELMCTRLEQGGDTETNKHFVVARKMPKNPFSVFSFLAQIEDGDETQSFKLDTITLEPLSYTTQSKVKPIYFPNKDIESQETEAEFYEEWRKRCICRLSYPKDFLKVRGNKRSRTLNFGDGDSTWKPGEPFRKGKESCILNLTFPSVRLPFALNLPTTNFPPLLQTPSFSSIANQLLDSPHRLSNDSENLEWFIHHPAISCILKVVQGNQYDYVLSDFVPTTLENLFSFSRETFDNDTVALFLVFQLIRAVQFSHQQGLIHGNLTPYTILTTSQLWLSLTGFTLPKEPTYLTIEEAENLHRDNHKGSLREYVLLLL